MVTDAESTADQGEEVITMTAPKGNLRTGSAQAVGSSLVGGFASIHRPFRMSIRTRPEDWALPARRIFFTMAGERNKIGVASRPVVP